MYKDNYTSLLPAIKNIGSLSFWQVLGLSSMLSSCHSKHSDYIVLDMARLIEDAFINKRINLFFNDENKPFGFSIYKKSSDNYFEGRTFTDKTILFESIVFPFTSPLKRYRLLKKYYLDNKVPSEKAYLIDFQEEKTRAIW